MSNSGNRKQAVGRWGENAAAEFLAEKGLAIIGRNVHTPHGEIDLIAEDQHQYVFVEVKTRHTRRFGPPEISINEKKKDHMVNSAFYYLQENDLLEHDWRIDVISIQTQPRGQTAFNWFRNAIES